MARQCKGCGHPYLMVWPDTPWNCVFCAKEHEVCIECYIDHTATHEAELSPEIARKRLFEKCGAPAPNGTDVTCRAPWGHRGNHHEARPGEYSWPRNGD